MKYFEKVAGEKVYLSPMSLEDAQEYTRWMNDLPTTECLGGSSRIITLEDEKKWIASRSGAYNFAIVERGTDKLLGNCELMDVDFIQGKATVGIVIGPEECRGKGYGTEALNLLLRYGFDYLNLNNIMLMVFAFNKRAIRCYEKVGFQQFGRRRSCFCLKGEWHDEVYMDILADEWRALQNK